MTPASLTDTLTGHEMLDSDGQDDGEFLLVKCACGWGAGRLSTADAFATYAEHLEDAAEAALALAGQIRSEAQAIRWEAGHLSEPHNRLERIHGMAEAILALTGDTEEAT